MIENANDQLEQAKDILRTAISKSDLAKQHLAAAKSEREAAAYAKDRAAEVLAVAKASATWRRKSSSPPTK